MHLSELIRLRENGELPLEDYPTLLGALEAEKARLWAELLTPNIRNGHDELLDANEAAARLKMSPDYLYRHSDELPFTHRMGRRVRFSAHGIDAYLAGR